MAHQKICAFCGKEYIGKTSRSMYCSIECRREADKQRKFDRYYTRNKVCEVCGKPLPKNSYKYCSVECKTISNQGCAYSSKPVKRICVECGKEYIGSTHHPEQKYCSKRCKGAKSEFKHKKIREFRMRTNSSSEFDSSITLEDLFERDNGICYICGDKCDKSDRYFVVGRNGKKRMVCGNSYPSIDHIYPLSKGGAHSWDNVKLAHMRCNRMKSDKVI